MVSETARLSADLLQAERAMQTGSVDQEQEARWIELMSRWTELARRDDDRRRFLRYDCDLEIRLAKPSGEKRTFRVTEISNYGMQIKGNLGSWLRTGESVVWDAVYTDDMWQRISAACTVARKPNRWTAGLSLDDSSMRSRRRIHRTTYYPAYIHRLRTMAADPANA